MQNMCKPHVSICIPTYCGSAFLAETIESVLNQSYQNFELIILDDNSPDDTEAVVSRYSDPRISYVRNASNLGPEGNWNRCIELARGQYFKLLPHDDVLAIDCLEKQVSVLDEDSKSEIVLVFGAREVIDLGGTVLMRRGLPRAKSGRIEGRKLIKRCIRAGTNLIGEPGNGLLRHELVVKVGGYDAKYPYLIDLDYWFRILLHGDAYYLEEVTSSFRLCPGSWSVAIGVDQYQNFKGFVNKFCTASGYQISGPDRFIGLLRARINNVIRSIIYRYLFPVK